MKLLLDENLSRRLVPFLQNDFLGSTHVVIVNLQSSTDLQIWDFAKRNDFVIVTRDADFYELSLLNQTNAPKIIWLRVSNVIKGEILSLLLKHKNFIQDQLFSKQKVCVEILESKNINKISI